MILLKMMSTVLVPFAREERNSYGRCLNQATFIELQVNSKIYEIFLIGVAINEVLFAH